MALFSEQQDVYFCNDIVVVRYIHLELCYAVFTFKVIPDIITCIFFPTFVYCISALQAFDKVSFHIFVIMMKVAPLSLIPSYILVISKSNF